jgi:hypothetical protein
LSTSSGVFWSRITANRQKRQILIYSSNVMA